MQIRTDFVTNSSSSNFIVARKGELTQRQKDALIAYVEKHMLGDVLLKSTSTEEEIAQVIEDHYFEEYETKIRAALKEGKDIYNQDVSFDECDYHIQRIYLSLLEACNNASDDEFQIIKDDLSY